MQVIPRLTTAAALCCVLLTGCTTGHSLFAKGEKLERQGNLDEAVLRYSEALSANPGQSEYRVRFLSAREKASNMHYKKGLNFEEKHRYDDALREYQSAVALEPGNDVAAKRVEAVKKLRDSITFTDEGKEMEKNRKFREAYRSYKQALALNPDNKEAVEGINRLLQSKKTKVEGYELNLKSNKPISIKFKDAKLKDVFTILTQLSGINFIYDDTLRDQNITIFLENASFQQAMDVLTNIAKLGKKVVGENAIIVYPRTPEKSKQYEELFVKTFYLTNLDAKKAVNLLRTMLQLKKVYVNEELNAVVVRDTPEMVDVAQKILDANDLPEAEVLLEVEVLEISKSNTETFGLALSKYSVTMGAGKGGDLLSDTLVPPTVASTTSSSGTGITSSSSTDVTNLLNVFAWRGFNGFMTVPNATYNFGKSLADGQVLQNPKMRVRNREKAKFNVGTRVPITTTSSNGTVGGVNVNVQYVDVGVKLNAEPTIQPDNQIVMKLGLEVSSILSTATVGADKSTTVVTIGTRNLDTVLSLKDGETSVIGGLLTDDKEKNKDQVSLLGDLPVLGTLLSSTSDADTKRELILSITPRIVRPVAIPDPDVGGFWSGREDEPTTVKPYPGVQPEPDFVTTGQPAAAAAPQQQAQQPSLVGKPMRPRKEPRKGAEAGPAPAPAAPTAAVPAPAAEQAAEAAQAVAPEVSAPPVPSVSQLPAQPSQPVLLQAPGGAPVVVAAPASGATTPPGVPPQAQPAPGAAQPAQGAPAAPAAAPEAAPTAEAAKPAEVPIPLTISAPPTVKAGENFTVDVKTDHATGVFSAPFVLTFDPDIAEFVSASEGDFLRQDGKPTAFQTLVDKDQGRVEVTLSRTGFAGGVNGSGVLMRAVFKAKTAGPLNMGFQNVRFIAPGGRVLNVVPGNAVIQVN